MQSLSSINFNNINTAKPPKFGDTISSVADIYDEFMERKNNYIAVHIANSNKQESKQRAGAAAIGMVGGLLNFVALSGLYMVLKAFPKMNKIPLLDKFVVQKFDKWIGRGKKLASTNNRFLNMFSGLYLKAIYSMGIGALIGIGTSIYTSVKGTLVNGRIGRTRQGAQGRWIADGLKEISQTDEGKLLIKNSIKKNNDKSITVKFAGINKAYIISKKELKQASKEYIAHSNENGKILKYEKKYSKGDGDVLAFEVAFEKYCNEVKTGKSVRDSHLQVKILNISEEYPITHIDGKPEDIKYLLSEKNNNESTNTNSNAWQIPPKVLFRN